MSTVPNGFETPKTNWQAADVPTPTDFNRIEGNLQAIEEGSRTVDQTQSPSGLAGSLRQFLDWISNRIKAILGTTNWYDSPPVTLTVAKNHIDNKSNPHNVTAAQVGAATPAQLAAKVDKPASAVSGNIAVFDGGAGKLKDGGQSINALTWVKPGNNIAVSHLPEESFLSSSRVNHGLMFSAIRPGKYRITGEIKAKADATGCVNIGIFLLYSASNVYRMESAANEFSTTSTSYVTFTVDMDKPVAYGGIIYVNVNRAMVRNIRLRYADDFNPVPEFLGRM